MKLQRLLTQRAFAAEQNQISARIAADKQTRQVMHDMDSQAKEWYCVACDMYVESIILEGMQVCQICESARPGGGASELTLEQALLMGVTEEQFEEMDEDGNGTVSPDEAAKYLSRMNLDLSAEDQATEKKKVKCSTCDGKGHLDDGGWFSSHSECPECGASGEVHID